MSDTRPVRVCDICGGVDDHPRHVIAHAPGQAPAVDQDLIETVIGNEKLDAKTRAAVVRDLQDTTIQLRHMDCCREVGCPDGSCELVLAEANGAKGAALVKHLTSHPSVAEAGEKLNAKRAAGKGI